MAQKRKPISPQVIEYMLKHPNQHIHINTIASDLGDTTVRVNNALWHLSSRKPELGIRTVGNGVFIYSMVPSNEEEKKKNGEKGKLFSLIGKAKDGSLILECEDGTLVRAVEL